MTTTQIQHQNLQQAVVQSIRLGWKLVYQNDTTAVFESANSANPRGAMSAGQHLLFFFGGFISAGILWVAWPFVALNAEKNRQLNQRTMTVTVDRDGNVQYSGEVVAAKK